MNFNVLLRALFVGFGYDLIIVGFGYDLIIVGFGYDLIIVGFGYDLISGKSLCCSKFIQFIICVNMIQRLIIYIAILHLTTVFIM